MITNLSIIFLFIFLIFFLIYANKYIMSKKCEEIINKNEFLEKQLEYLRISTEKLLYDFERIVHENNKLKIQIERLNNNLEHFIKQITNNT